MSPLVSLTSLKTPRFSPPGYACITSSVLAVLVATLPNAAEHWPAGEVLGWPLLSLGFGKFLLGGAGPGGPKKRDTSLNASWPFCLDTESLFFFTSIALTRCDVCFFKFRWMLLINLSSYFVWSGFARLTIHEAWNQRIILAGIDIRGKLLVTKVSCWLRGQELQPLVLNFLVDFIGKIPQV